MAEKLNNVAGQPLGPNEDIPYRVYKKTHLPALREKTREIEDVQVVDSHLLESLETYARVSCRQLREVRARFERRNLAEEKGPGQKTLVIVDDLITKTTRLMDDLSSLNEFSRILSGDGKGKTLGDDERGRLTIVVRILKRNLMKTLNDVARITFESPFTISNLLESAKRVITPLLASAVLAGLMSSDTSSEQELGTKMVAETKQVKKKSENGKSLSDKRNKMNALSGNGSSAPSEKPLKSKPGDSFRPNIESFGTAGEFPSGKPIAEISFARGSQISDPLWMTEHLYLDAVMS